MKRSNLVVVLLCLTGGCGGGGPGTETSPVVPVPNGAPVRVELSDGTAILFPAVTDPGADPSAALTEVQVSRSGNDVALPGTDLEIVGPMVTLEFEPFDRAAFASNENGGVGRVQAASFIPTITFPRGSLGGEHTAETVVIARVGDLLAGDEVEPGAVRYLPATVDDAGNLQVSDFYLPQSILTDLEARAALGLRANIPPGIQARKVRYVAASLLVAANWAKEARLVRMVPIPTAPYRVPLSALEQTDPAAARAERERCVNNLLVFVHGHNEQEKGGFEAPAIDEPWEFPYKRDVWTLFYDNLAQADSQDRLGCTAFYELIYPTYRPIVTPVGGVKRLDQSFAELLEKELKPFLDSGDDYRLYILAHSMGGPVSRAGIQIMNEKLHTWFQKLVTWGSPHLGSPLPSLAFGLGAAPPYRIHTPPGWTALGLDLSSVDALYEMLIELVNHGQLLAPGPRDYRWAGSSTNPEQHTIRLDNVLELSEAQQGSAPLLSRFNLQTGTLLYNDNLRNLNTADRYFHSGKYAAVYGTTPKRPTWKKTAFGYLSYPDPASTTQTGFGAYAIELLMDSVPNYFLTHNKNESDGAVPLESMIGSGIFGLADLYFLADMDHEEYYGAADASGAFTQEEKAARTLIPTLTALQFLGDGVGCPDLTFTKEPAASYTPADTLSVAGALVWPGDSTPGSRIVTVTLEGDGEVGALGDLIFGADGSFSGDFDAADLPAEQDLTLRLIVLLKDQTQQVKEWRTTTKVPVERLYAISLSVAWGTGCPAPCGNDFLADPGVRVSPEGAFSIDFSDSWYPDSFHITGTGTFQNGAMSLTGSWTYSRMDTVIGWGTDAEGQGSFTLTATGWDGIHFAEQSATISYSSACTATADPCTCSGDGTSASLVINSFYQAP